MPRARPRAAILMLLASAMILAGCNKTTGQLGPASSLSTASTTPLSLDALAELGDKWQANPRDASKGLAYACLLYTSPSPRDRQKSRMPSSA